MKKVVTAVVLFTLMVTPALSVSAQKTRNNLRKADQTIIPVSAPASTESSFDKVEAFSDGRKVLVRWAMKQEVNNFGFNVYRIDSNGEQRVTEHPVLGAATRFHAPIVDGQTYEFLIESRDRIGVYTIEAIGMDGRRLRADGIVPARVSRLNLVSSRPLVTPRDGNVEAKDLSLPRDLFREVESYAVASDPTVHRSVISRPGVKLGVKGEGLFRVTRAQLQAGGFDVNGESSKWQLHVNGIEQALNIGPNADYIEFYGKGVDTIES